MEVHVKSAVQTLYCSQILIHNLSTLFNWFLITVSQHTNAVQPAQNKSYVQWQLPGSKKAHTTCRLLCRCEHLPATVSACASLLYALRVLWAHGMPETALQTVDQATVMAKVLYATSAWWGFASASDRQRIEAFVGRAKRCGLCHADQPPVVEVSRTLMTNCFSLCYIILNVHYTNCCHIVDMTLPTRCDMISR